MNRVALAVLGSVFVVAGCSTTKKQVARPEALPAATERGAQANTDPRAEPATGELREALLSLSRVHFGFDSATLQPGAREALAEAADGLRPHPEVHLFVDGHADERGTTEYNLALSDRRAQAVLDYLTRLGVPHERLRPVPKGEECPLAVGAGEHAWAANRRVDFRLMGNDVRLELREGQPFHDHLRPLGSTRRASDNGVAIDGIAGR